MIVVGLVLVVLVAVVWTVVRRRAARARPPAVPVPAAGPARPSAKVRRAHDSHRGGL